MKIFVDANILFSASMPDSATRRLFEILHSSGHDLVTSDNALEEAERNLSLKFGRYLEALAGMRSKIQISNQLAELPEIRINENDRIILSSAVAAGCDVFWTGDKRNFGSYYGKMIRGVKVLSSVMLAELALA